MSKNVEYRCEWWREGQAIWGSPLCSSREDAEKILAGESSIPFDEGRIVEVKTSTKVITYVFKSAIDTRGCNGDEYLI